jgi:hypothetical protein
VNRFDDIENAIEDPISWASSGAEVGEVAEESHGGDHDEDVRPHLHLSDRLPHLRIEMDWKMKTRRIDEIELRERERMQRVQSLLLLLLLCRTRGGI